MPTSFFNFLLIGLASFISSAVSLYFLIPYLTKKAFLDIPNARSSHKKITPRGGGLGIIIGILVGALLGHLMGLALPPITFFIGFGLMAGISFIDDKKNLPAGLRLGVHLTAMALVLYQTGGLHFLPFPEPLNIELGIWGYLISAIWIVAVVNFYNFLDGIDGYAGTQALFAAIGLMSVQGGAIGSLALCIAFSTLGFLLYNWSPAKIFMGDVGSVSLGFAFATLPFYSQDSTPEALVFTVALFLWFFLADGAVTLIHRILKKEKIWQPHRTHLYQRLNQSGWSHRQVVMTSMFFTFLIICTQVYFYTKNHPLQWISPLVALAFFSLFFTLVIKREKKAQ